MPVFEWVFLVVKLFTVIAAASLVLVARRSYRKSHDRSMQLLAAGLAGIGGGAVVSLIGPMILGFAILIWFLESVVIMIAVACLMASVWLS